MEVMVLKMSLRYTSELHEAKLKISGLGLLKLQKIEKEIAGIECGFRWERMLCMDVTSSP